MRAALVAAVLLAAQPAPTSVSDLAFHHLHLRDARPESRIAFYERLFDPAVRYRIAFGDAQGLLTGTRRILVSVATPGEKRPAALWHFGWGGVSLAETYLAHARSEVAWEPPLPPEALHVHLRSASPTRAAAWYRDVLGANAVVPQAAPQPRAPLPPPEHRMPGALVTVGGLPLLIYPADRPLASSLGSGIDHVAFTCRAFDDTLGLLRARQVTILREPYLVDGVRAAMIQGPDLIAIELLEGSQ